MSNPGPRMTLCPACSARRDECATCGGSGEVTAERAAEIERIRNRAGRQPVKQGATS